MASKDFYQVAISRPVRHQVTFCFSRAMAIQLMQNVYAKTPITRLRSGYRTHTTLQTSPTPAFLDERKGDHEVPRELPIKVYWEAVQAMTHLQCLIIHHEFIPSNLDMCIPLRASLQILELHDIHNVDDCRALAQLTNLRQLRLKQAWSQSILDLSPLSNLYQLEVLNLSNMPYLSTMAALEALALHTSPSQLKTLILDNLEHYFRPGTPWKSLTVLAPFTILTSLTLAGYFPQMTDLRILPSLTNLESLTLHRITGLYSMDGLVSCTQLHELALDTSGILDLWDPVIIPPQLTKTTFRSLFSERFARDDIQSMAMFTAMG